MPLKTLAGREDLIYIVAMAGLSVVGLAAMILGTWEEISKAQSQPVLWSLATSCVWALIHTITSWKASDGLEKRTNGAGIGRQSDPNPH